MIHWWVSTPNWTCLISEQNGKIVDSANYLWRWRGKDFEYFVAWCQSRYGTKLRMEILSDFMDEAS